MPQAFDPYREWLGIADARETPNHYRLLGLRLFEDNASAISAAAVRWSSMLVHQLSGPHRAEAEKVLGEMDLARRCLLQPSSKQQYDQLLRSELISEAPVPQSHFVSQESADPLLPPTAGPIASGQPVQASQANPSPPTSVWQPAAASLAPPPPTSSFETPAAMPPSAFGQSPPSVAAASPLPPTSPGGSYGSATAAMAPSSFGSATAMPAAPMPPLADDLMPPTAMPAPLPTAYPAMPAPAVAYAQPVYPAAPYYPTAVPVPTPIQAQAIPVYPAASPAAYAPQAVPVAGPVAAAAIEPAPMSGGPAIVAPSPVRAWRSRKSTSTALYIGLPIAAVVLVVVVVLANQQAQEPPMQPAVARGSAGDASTARRTQWSIERRPGSESPRPNDRSRSNPPDSENDQAMAGPSPAMPKDNPSVTVTVPQPPMPAPVPPTPVPPATPAAGPNAAQQALAAKALVAARVALSKGDVPRAKAQLDAARKADAEGMAAEGTAAEIARVDALTQYVEGFWKAVNESIAGLVVGGQVTLREKVVGVVEVDAQKLILRVDGENRTYARDDLPIGVAFGLAESWFNKGDPASKIFLGAIHVVHPKGDRQQARQLWEQAAAGGQTEQVALVFPELSVPRPTDAEAAGMLAENQAGPDGRLAAPGAAALAKARTEARQMFEADLAEAKAPAQKLELAEKMFTRVDQVSDPSPLRYALLSEASQLAAESGNFDRMAAMLDRQAELFGIDGVDAKSDTLFEAAKNTDTPEGNQALATFALSLSDEAILLDNISQAKKLVRIALTSARKGGDPELLKQCSARDKDVKLLRD